MPEKCPQPVSLRVAKDPRTLESAALSPAFCRHAPLKKLESTRMVSAPRGLFAMLRMTTLAILRNETKRYRGRHFKKVPSNLSS